jgi:maltose alpha-D-glucosyltransferase / alpha-amylase
MADRRLWPSDPKAADRLLTFFLIEKAFGELEHELSWRPDWLRMPLAGIIRLLSPSAREAS